MAITTALLEFLVIGSLWMLAIVSLLLVLRVPLTTVLGAPGLAATAPYLALLAIPLTYFLGVIAQAATWRYWYLPRHHLPALTRLLEGPQKRAFNRLLQVLGSKMDPDLKPSFATLATGQQVGQLLDLLRIEILHPTRLELAHQYQIQFHLYRLTYGSIPAVAVLGCVLLGGLVIDLITGRYERLVVCAVLGSLAWIVAVLAIVAAAHRRQRLWKFLLLGACLFITQATDESTSNTSE